MRRRSVSDMWNVPSDKVSGLVLVLLVTVSVIMFGAFFLAGYDRPYEEDTSYNAPLLTDALIVFTYVLMAVAVAVAVVSVFRGVRMRGGAGIVSNRVPSGKIASCTIAVLLLTLAVTFVSGSAEPLRINGKPYSDSLWLKLTDMLINTSVILMVIASAAVLYGMSGLSRRGGGKRKSS